MKKQLKYVRVSLDYIQRLSCVGGIRCEEEITKIYFMMRHNDDKIVFICAKHGLKNIEYLKEYDFKFLHGFDWHDDECTCEDVRQHRKDWLDIQTKGHCEDCMTKQYILLDAHKLNDPEKHIIMSANHNTLALLYAFHDQIDTKENKA